MKEIVLDMNIGLEQLCIIAKNSFEWSKLEIYWGGGRGEKGEGSGGENPVLMKAIIFFIVSHLHFEKQMALNRTN